MPSSLGLEINDQSSDLLGVGRIFPVGGEQLEVATQHLKVLRSRTLYLGDGINDAPAMMTATAGIALGVNSDITSEAAGAVVLQSSLVSVDELMHMDEGCEALRSLAR